MNRIFKMKLRARGLSAALFCCLKQDGQDLQDEQDEEAIAGDRPPHYGGPGGAPP